MIFQTDKSLSPATREWSFTVPPFAMEQQVRLALEARIDSPGLGGSNPWMRVEINGNFLTKEELLNKTFNFTANNGRDLTWAKGTAWRVLYSPDFTAAATQKDAPWGLANTEPYRFVWDITSFVKPGKNELKIINLKVLQNKPSTLILRNAVVEISKPEKPPIDPTTAVIPAPTGPLETFIDYGKQQVPMQVRAAPGYLQLTVAGQKFDVTTRTSLPAGKWQEPQSPENAAAFNNGQTKTISWQTPLYSVQRQIEVRDDHIHIADTFTNTSPQLVGVMLENQLTYPLKPLGAFAAGQESSGRNMRVASSRNPSVFASWPQVGVGMVAEDDVFRVQGTQLLNEKGISLEDNQLGVESGKPVTLEWSIYPVPHKSTFKGDYWDFVNAVRRNWNVNFTIPGPFSFTMAFHNDTLQHSAQWYGQWMRARDLKIVAGGIAKYSNRQYAHGTGILAAPDWVAKEKDWISKVHQGAPDVKALCYFHAQLSSEPDGETKYAADRLHNAKGTPMSYPSGRQKLPIYLPTQDSVYGKALWGYVHTILDTIGADGMYWDEMSGSVLGFAYDAPWDGHTVIIDPKTHAITGKRSSVPLLMQPLKLAIVHYLRDHGKYLMGNSQAATRTMMRENIVRFVETGSYSRLSSTNLECPLGLGNHHAENTQADSTRNVREMLKRGALYYAWTYQRDAAPWNFTSVMYPITPAKLGSGFVIGKERIITTISGRFAFDDGRAAHIYVVDANGTRVKNPRVKESKEKGKYFYEIRIPSDQFAVLVKRK